MKGPVRAESLTRSKGPADTRILDFGNPIPSDTPWVTTGLAQAEGLTGAEFPADTRILDFGNPTPSDTPWGDNGSRQGWGPHWG